MTTIDELRTELEAKFDIKTAVRDITMRLNMDIRSMLGGFNEDTNFMGGFDETGQFMVKLGLIRTARSSFNPSSYSYTPKARDLYARLKEENYYEL